MTEVMNFETIRTTVVTTCKTFLLCGGIYAVCLILDMLPI